jgi:hypothetical protein
VIDSVAALVPKAELEGEMGDSHMALQARFRRRVPFCECFLQSCHKALVIVVVIP